MASGILTVACSNGDLQKVQDLLDSDWKPSQEELDTALYNATWKGFVAITALLLSSGACITDMAFIGATHNEDPAIFQEFLNHGWDINSTEFGDPALRYQFLILYSLIPISKQYSDRLVVSNETCVRWLLEHGADPNQKSDEGFTPLATAALFPSITILELLITHGAKLDPEALTSAISRRGNGGIPVMKYLIDQGIDLNVRVENFSSALHYAVHQAGPPDRVRLLLDNGADRSLQNTFGQTPLEAARESRHQIEDAMKVYEMLLEE
jgi:hypothetical protein